MASKSAAHFDRVLFVPLQVPVSYSELSLPGQDLLFFF